MELVYLWVEDYKNIQKQGFNFSPNFDVEFTPVYEDEKLSEKSELKITPKENLLKDFFGKDINVTAIVGENGSGKSSILEYIEKIILADSAEEASASKYILVYKNIIPLYISNFNINTSIEKTDVFDDICSLVYKNDILNEKIHQAKYYSSANLHYLTLEKQGIVNILSAKENDIKTFHISSFMYLPEKIEISVKEYKKLIQEHTSFLNFRKLDKIREELEKITDSYDQYLSILYIRQKGLGVNPSVLRNRKLLLKNTKGYLSIDDFSTFFITVLSMKEYKISKLSQEQKDIYFHKDYYHYFEFDFIDEKERRYNHLSHGEKVIFSQLLSIFFYINANEKLLFLFDEPEIALHPNWQKKYLNEVINLLQKIPKKYHFIFATHSPFLLSDLVKENVIFLEKDEKTGNCINTSDKVDINPFGANIHTLLSHGFFMKDGLMGEFAKDKINEVINFLNGSDSSIMTNDKAQDLINIIGEPVIKKQLQKMLDSKRLSKIDEIDLIKNQMELLSKRLEEIENAKD